MSHPKETANMTYEVATDKKLSELSRYHASKVLEHQTKLAALSRTINSRLPALSLPAELIVSIFTQYRELEVAAIFWPRSDRRKLDKFRWSKWWWIVPIHICHRWRTIALASPILWRYVDNDIFSIPHLLDIALDRSRQTPLDIEIVHGLVAGLVDADPCIWRDEQASLQKILQQSHRIRRLHLEMPQSLIDDSFTNKTVQHTFVALEALHINSITFLDTGLDIDPAILQSSRAPSGLRSLTLEGVAITWEILINLPPTLTHMEIDFSSHNPAGTCDGILSVLERLPRLECLYLTEIPLEPQTTNKTVHLPNIKKLTLRQSISCDILFLILGLSFPTNITSTLYIGFNSEDPTSISTVPFRSVFAKLGFSVPPSERVKAGSFSVAVGFCPDDDSKLYLSASKIDHTTSRCSQHDFSLWLTQHGGGDDIAQDAPPWLDFLDLVSTTIYPYAESTTFTNLDLLLSEEAFAQTLHRASSLEKITLDRIGAACFVPSAFRVLPDGTIPVPKLREVAVLNHGHDHIDGEDLFAVVKERKEKGCGIEQIYLRARTVLFDLPDTLDNLQALVDLGFIPG
ncbi:hypothetical protein QCA50_020275 [Cerrena zonata]|uniref:F-box domain-containing protein n=1 Tax=Cerrena zonata TaxID=2478898 RepID=A0AAW0FHT2_9APHY